MRPALPLLALSLLLLTDSLLAQGRPNAIMTFEEYERVSEHALPYIREFQAGEGRLLYFGSSHTYDPDDPQVSQIVDLWQSSRPDVAFFEGWDPDNPLPRPAATREDAVRRFGESGLVIYLAATNGVTGRTLEPAQREEIGLLRQTYTAEQVKLFYVLRQVPQFKNSKQDRTLDSFVGVFTGELSRKSGLEGAPSTLSEFEGSVTRLLPQLKDWREIPQAWFDPTTSPPPTYLNTISRQLAEFRDQHMVKLLLAEVKQGSRVFAVVGASHVVMQEPAFKAELQVPAR